MNQYEWKYGENDHQKYYGAKLGKLMEELKEKGII